MKTHQSTPGIPLTGPRTRRVARTARAGLVAACLFVLCTTGCKTKPAPDSGFLDHAEQMSAKRERYPFQRVWAKEGGMRKDFADSVIIAPVNTTYLMENTGWKAANPGNLQLEQAARDLALYTQNTFKEAFTSSPNNSIRVVEEKGPRTAILELAIVELVPSKVALNALSLASPDPAIGVAAGVAAGKPSVAIEGRVRNSESGEVVFMFADRDEPQYRIVNLQGLTWWSHARESIRNWAKATVELANTPPEQRVKDRFIFTLKPW